MRTFSTNFEERRIRDEYVKYLDAFRTARLLPRPYKVPVWRPRAAPRINAYDPFVFIKTGYQDE